MTTTGLGLLNAKFTFKGTSATNHFCTDSKANECLTTLSLTVFTERNLNIAFFRFVTIHAFDGQTDGQTDRILIARPRLHSMQRAR